MNGKILIVDDKSKIRHTLTDIFREDQFDVNTAGDGLKAIAVLDQWKPDLVISGVHMPNKSGMDLVSHIQRKNPGVETILMAHHNDEAAANDCLRCGCYDYLHRPLDHIDVLKNSVKRAMEKRQLVLRNEELVRQLEEVSTRDPLTGLYNIRQMNSAIDQEIDRAERYRHPFYILLLDIDYFKQVNDTYGHPVGDFVVIEIGAQISKEIRTSDSIYRYGGDEFLVLLTEVEKDDADIVAVRILEKIRSHTFRTDGHRLKAAISVGGAGYPDDATTKKDLIKLADQALYRAKDSGRDQVMLYS